MGIELANTTIDSLYNDNFNIYKAFGTSEEKLYMSYVSSDSEGTALKPSTLILKLKKMFPKLKEDSDIINKKAEISVMEAIFDELLLNIRNFKDGKDIEDIWYAVYKIFEEDETWSIKLKEAIKGLEFSNRPENLNPDNIKKLYGDTLKVSTTKLESYRKCAFSFYLTYALNLKEEKKFKLESLDTGSFMHDVIDSFFEEIDVNRN